MINDIIKTIEPNKARCPNCNIHLIRHKLSVSDNNKSKCTSEIILECVKCRILFTTKLSESNQNKQSDKHEIQVKTKPKNKKAKNKSQQVRGKTQAEIIREKYRSLGKTSDKRQKELEIINQIIKETRAEIRQSKIKRNKTAINQINKLASKKPTKIVTPEKTEPQIIKPSDYPIDVWVYTNFSNLKCNKDNHKVVPRTVIVNVYDSDKKCHLPINHCLTCLRYYVSFESVFLAEVRLGKLLIIVNKIPLMQNNDRRYHNRNEMSELRSYGYNVIAGKLTESQRQSRIKYLIENNYMTPFAIKRDITNAINEFSNRYNYRFAIQKWKDDLVFVDSYKPGKYAGYGVLMIN